VSPRTVDPLVRDYLKRLHAASRGLPRGRRDELHREIDAHLAEALGPDATQAEVRTVLERLGDPEDILAEELQPASRGTREWAAIVLLPFGGFIAGVGWFIGVFLLWTSEAWTLRDKLIGTLVLPGGLTTILVASVMTLSGGASGRGQSSSSNTLGIALFVLVAIAPIITAVYLARRANTGRYRPSQTLRA